MTRVYLHIGMSVITLILKLIRRSSSRRGNPLFQRGIALNHLFDDSLFPTKFLILEPPTEGWRETVDFFVWTLCPAFVF